MSDRAVADEFLAALYGTATAGHIAIWNKQTKETAWFPVSEMGRAADAVAAMADGGRDVYFGVGLHGETLGKTQRGTAEGVIAVPGLWLDIDIAGPNHAQTNLPPDIGAAMELLSRLPLEPTVTVMTGGGIHAYWLFKELALLADPAEREACAALSRRFQATVREWAREKGWQIDNTSDLARVLRVPGTFNYKSGTPVPVVANWAKDPDRCRYDLSEFEPYLLDDHQPGAAEDLPAGDSDFPTPDASRIVGKCAWLRHCRDDAVALPYPEWYRMLGIAARCEGGRELAHEWSRPYPRYAAGDTEKYIKQALERGPATCDYIAASYSGPDGRPYCYGCKHRSKVKSPIVLGHPGKKSGTAPAGGIAEEMGVRIEYGETKDVNPLVFARHVAGRMDLLVTQGGRFYEYGGGVWAPLDRLALARRLLGVIDEAGGEAWEPSWEDRYMKALERVAPYEEQLDRDRRFLNLENGMLKVAERESGEGGLYGLSAHDPAFRSSIRIPIRHDPGAECPAFLRYLDEVTCGDAELIAVLQEMMGYCLTTETLAQKAFLLFGEGANGKSVFLEVLRSLCGEDNVSNVSMSELTERFSRSRLVGKLVNVSSENEVGPNGFETGYFKRIVSGDEIEIEEKYKAAYTWKPTCKMVYAVNRLPASRDTSMGYFRRLVIVPFRRVFLPAEADPRLPEKLLAELPGILNFAVAGLARLRENGYRFSEARSSADTLTAYKAEQNPAGAFWAECVVPKEGGRVTRTEIWDRFVAWASENGVGDAGEFRRSRTRIYTEFRGAASAAGIGLRESKSNGKWIMHGIAFAENDREGEEDGAPDRRASIFGE